MAKTTTPRATRGAMTAAEFFEQQYAGGRRTDAVREAHLSSYTVHQAAKGLIVGRRSAMRLQSWSLTVVEAARAGAWISAIRTMRVREPTAEELRRAAGGGR